MKGFFRGARLTVTEGMKDWKMYPSRSRYIDRKLSRSVFVDSVKFMSKNSLSTCKSVFFAHSR